MSASDKIVAWGRSVFQQEAEALQKIAATVDENFQKVVQLILSCKGRIVVSGIGKSAIIAEKMVATFNSTGTPAIFLHAADAIHGDLGMVQNGDVVLLVSKSGESPEIRSLASIFKSWNNAVVAMVSNPSSFLAKETDFILWTPIDEEACPNNLAPTTSTTAQMVMGDALAVCLMHLKEFGKSDFARLHPGGNLGKRLLLHLSDIYPENLQPSVHIDAKLKDVINTLSQGRLGAVAVVDSDNKVLGIITDGDIRRLLQNVDDIKNIICNDFYTKGSYTALPSLLAVDALELMKSHDITQLIVTDEERHFLGFVHLHDLVKEGLG